MNILFFGPPGAGKGTQSALLVERRQMAHISTGDLFRENIKNGTPLGKEAKGYMDAGKYVPDEVTLGMVKEVFENKDISKGFILDGFPRTTPQAEALDTLLGEKNLELGSVIFIEVPNELLLGRLTGRRVCRDCGTAFHVEFKPTAKEGVCDECGGETYQRSDDSADVVGTRLEVYEKNTAPLKEYYKAKGLVEEVDGQGSADEVFGRIEAILNR